MGSKDLCASELGHHDRLPVTAQTEEIEAQKGKGLAPGQSTRLEQRTGGLESVACFQGLA